ncbi:electron transfer flavoprotein subunit alpha/FixB family protein [Sporomusa sp.]|uniref:electron transfer flavoprotein subunit alpha/FixB family protein n=1 Tax=Sporomusa sp. TaxID=2078658 RepID=UPI002C3F8A7B|nr:FAD-binding protein [Sporomusa sp.]HWR06813.1 FAD-binding protein [Sporomusa sp.]
MKILVFAERNTALAELCSGARSLGDQIEAVVIGTPGALAVDKIWSIPVQENVMLEDYTDSIAAVMDLAAANMLLIESTKRCKLIAGRLAAIKGCSAITDVMEIADNLATKRMVYGGAAVRQEKAVAGPAIIIAGPGVLTASAIATGQGVVETAAYIEPVSRIKIVSRVQKTKVTVNLSAAKKIIGVGRGIAKQEDLTLIRELADAFGAEQGCTRPIAEAEKWLPKETYIGVSGLMLAPELYIAVGISGQIQHTVGINRSKVIVAINKDKNAPIFKQADYGIVGDLYKVVPALISQLK